MVGVQRAQLISDQWACIIARIVNDLRAKGLTSAPQIAMGLNDYGIPTLRNRRWRENTVKNLLARYAELRRRNPQLVAATLLNPPPALITFIARHQAKHVARQHALREDP